MFAKKNKIIFLSTLLFSEGLFSLHSLMASTTYWNNPAKAQAIQEIIDNILNFIVIIAIPIAVTFLIIAGLKFFSAQGNELKIKSAKKTILWTIVGTVILIGTKVISATITKFFETKGWSFIKKAYAGNVNVQPWQVPNLTNYPYPSDFISAIASFLLTIAIPLSVVAIIWTGIQFFLAQGNESKITNAKKTLKWAIIGLAVVIGAYAIVATIKEVI
ncbi:hypothetical protein D4R86_05255 [bacterium]|nr:MAG: hypothetical protein D4R86_05255 [bacterium]